MSKRLQIATFAVLLASGSAAFAQTTQIQASYSASATETSGTNGFTPSVTTTGLGTPFTQNLTVGVQTAQTTFISVNPTGGSSGVGTIQGTVSVGFTFTEPTGTVTGVTSTGHTATYSGGKVTVAANYELFYGTSPQTDCLTWNATTCTATGNTTTIGDTLAITFSDNAVLNVNLYNWSDWNMTPGISFKLVTAPSTGGGQTTVPEPASVALLGAALAGLGLMKRRRKSVKNSDTL